MRTENWLPVVGYEGLYEVSDWGRVKSLARRDSEGKRLQERILKAGRATKGHLTVSLCRNGKPRSRLVHTLVLEAFRGPRPFPEAVGRHFPDRDPTNNHLENLQWGTPAENSQDMLVHGTSHWANRTHCPEEHEYTPENIAWVRYTRADGSDHYGRSCRTCKNARQRARRAAAKW